MVSDKKPGAGRARHYDVLGVDMDASTDDIRAAYVAQAKRWHPDVHMDGSDDERADATERFRAVREAWDCLGDPERRAAYDRTLPGHRPTAGSDGAEARVRPTASTGPGPRESKPSTWLLRASLAAVVSRLDPSAGDDGAVTRASEAVYRNLRPFLVSDEPARSVGEAQRLAYIASLRAHAGWRGGGEAFASTPALAALVGESLWAVCHDLWARMAASDRLGLDAPPSQSGSSGATSGPCAVCGRTPTGSFAFRAIRGRGLGWRSRPIGGDFCADCALSVGRDAQHITLNSGWWGVLAVLRTVVALVINGRGLRRAAAIPSPLGEPARRRSALEPGPTVIGRGVSGLVMFVGLVVVLLIALGRMLG